MILHRRIIETPQLGGATTSLVTFGHGKLGGKISGVFDNAQPIVEAGLRMPPPGFALASGFFERFMYGPSGFRQHFDRIRAEADKVSLVCHIRSLRDSISFTDQEMEAIAEIERAFRGQVIAIRPSLEGESRGVGVTRTYVVGLFETPEENVQELADLIKTAIAYGVITKNALAYTRRKGVELEVALWILPVIGTKNIHRTKLSDIDFPDGEEFFYPAVAACGYTVARLDGKGRLLAVTGIGGKAVRGEGHELLFDGSGTSVYHRIELDQIDSFSISFNDLRERRLFGDNAMIYNMGVPFVNGDPRDALSRFAPNLYRLGIVLGSPHYFELAMASAEDAPTMLQLAEAPQYVLPEQTFDDAALVTSREVIGIGSKVCDKVLVVFGLPKEVKGIVDKFNLENKNYLLVVGSTALYDRNRPCLEYHNLSNAGAVVENLAEYAWRSQRTLEGHVKGLFMDSDILYLTGNLPIDKLGDIFGKDNVRQLSDELAFVVGRKAKVTVDERVPRGEVVLVD